MKARKYFYAIAAMLALAACSSDDLTVDETTTDEDSTGNSFMTVQLSLASTASTRSATYDAGDDSESYILVSNAKSIFLFYDGSGNYLTYGEFTNPTNTYIKPTSSDDTPSGISGTASVVLGPTTVVPSQMLCVFNYTGDDISVLKNRSLTEAVARTVGTSTSDENLTTTSGETSDTNKYLMMTSALRYNATDGFVRATAITSSNISTKENDNSRTAVTVYVEREAAKIKVDVNTVNTASASGNITSDKGTYYAIFLDDNGDERVYAYKTGNDNAVSAKLRAVVQGWAINATNYSGYVFKNYDQSDLSNDATLTTDWYDSDAGDRFHWASDANYVGGSGDTYAYSSSSSSWAPTYTTSGGNCFNNVNYLSWSDVTGTSTDAAYYHENTLNWSGQQYFIDGDEQACIPTLLLTAKLQISTQTTTTSDGTTTTAYGDYADISGALYRSSGVYYSEEGVKAVLASEISAAGYQWRTGTSGNYTYTNLSADEMSITYALAAVDNTSRVQVSSITLTPSSSLTSPVLVLKGDNSDTEVGTPNTTLTVPSTSSTEAETAFIKALNTTSLLKIDSSDSTSGLFCFNEGMCYYQAPIEHITVDSNTYYGVVRNTYYILTINSINNVGNPVYNKDEDIVLIPGEEQYYYMNISVNVLSWLKNTQTIYF